MAALRAKIAAKEREIKSRPHTQKVATSGLAVPDGPRADSAAKCYAANCCRAALLLAGSPVRSFSSRTQWIPRRDLQLHRAAQVV